MLFFFYLYEINFSHVLDRQCLSPQRIEDPEAGLVGSCCAAARQPPACSLKILMQPPASVHTAWWRAFAKVKVSGCELPLNRAAAGTDDLHISFNVCINRNKADVQRSLGGCMIWDGRYIVTGWCAYKLYSLTLSWKVCGNHLKTDSEIVLVYC